MNAKALCRAILPPVANGIDTMKKIIDFVQEYKAALAFAALFVIVSALTENYMLMLVILMGLMYKLS